MNSSEKAPPGNRGRHEYPSLQRVEIKISLNVVLPHYIGMVTHNLEEDFLNWLQMKRDLGKGLKQPQTATLLNSFTMYPW